MRLGIDFGTTRTLAAIVDRGNYPIVTFENLEGEFQEWFPSLLAVRGSERVYGFEALEKQASPEWTLHRSFKRLLAEAPPGADLFGVPSLTLVSEYLKTFRDALETRSNVDVDSSLEAVIGVPANSNSNQRFLTIEGFHSAGFDVIGVYNEPSAAGIEYADRYRRSDITKKREHLLVYDLGGGTFDASVIRMTGNDHSVVTSIGVSRLGGDDFDAILLEMAQPEAGGPRDQMLELCRLAKERLTPNSRKVALSLPATEVILGAEDFYRRCEPLVERTVDVLRAAMQTAGGEEAIGCVYVVGGASDFPIVMRTLRNHFGRRVRKSPYPHAATAIGLAIAADEAATFHVHETFTRYFGVWREADHGKVVSFDTIFPKDCALPARIVRSYSPAHNIGHFRYLECGELNAEGQPCGDITPWDAIVFPFEPNLFDNSNGTPIQASVDARHQEIEEVYTCDEHGIIEVAFTNKTAGQERVFRLKR